jgi:hypothetical protein
VPAAGRVDGGGAPSFDDQAMPQPSHIYASTLHRRGRRWSRRRPIWPAAALSALLVLAAAILIGGFA